MQILKGNNYKSVTVDNLLRCTDSYCYIYNDIELNFDCYYVNSKVATIDQLQGYLGEFIQYKNENKVYDYFIIYTNNTEDELLDLIKWLNGKEDEFNCKCILLTCR
jgi:hypothetical protein